MGLGEGSQVGREGRELRLEEWQCHHHPGVAFGCVARGVVAIDHAGAEEFQGGSGDGEVVRDEEIRQSEAALQIEKLYDVAVETLPASARLSWDGESEAEASSRGSGSARTGPLPSAARSPHGPMNSAHPLSS